MEVSNCCFNLYYMRSGDWLQCDLELNFIRQNAFYILNQVQKCSLLCCVKYESASELSLWQKKQRITRFLTRSL